MLLNTIPVFEFAAKIGGCVEKPDRKLKKVQNFFTCQGPEETAALFGC
jgi:hypothetical protein